MGLSEDTDVLNMLPNAAKESNMSITLDKLQVNLMSHVQLKEYKQFLVEQYNTLQQFNLQYRDSRVPEIKKKAIKIKIGMSKMSILISYVNDRLKTLNKEKSDKEGDAFKVIVREEYGAAEYARLLRLAEDRNKSKVKAPF